jgi:hypothetical protein
VGILLIYSACILNAPTLGINVDKDTANKQLEFMTHNHLNNLL